MREIIVRKEEQGGTVVLTFRFKALGQILDEGDPTPLPGKEMTEEAEDAIAGHLDEYRVSKSARVVIELPEKDLADTSSSLITEAVRHHFGFRQDDLNHDLKISRREGTYSLLLMLGNIALLVLFMFYLTKNEIPLEAGAVIILGFLTIMNWATIWDTYEHFVYDYRNLARRRRIFRKIIKTPVNIRGY